MADSVETDGSTDQPKPLADLTSKGRQSREGLLEAASVVFGRDGFVSARIADISAEAGMAHGSFYTYFNSKEEIFREVINGIAVDMAASSRIRASSNDPYQLVLLANQKYVAGYRRNAALMATFEQVSTFNPEIRQYRAELRRRYVERNSRAIKRWQEQGLADPLVDAEYAAIALGAMVDRFVYIWLVSGEEFDEEKAMETMTRLWVQGVGLKIPEASLSRGTTDSSRSNHVADSETPMKREEQSKSQGGQADDNDSTFPPDRLLSR